MIDMHTIPQRWKTDGLKRDEYDRRSFAAAKARAAGSVGLTAVSSVAGLARNSIERGQKDLDALLIAAGRVRPKGGSDRRLSERDPMVVDNLRRHVEPVTLGGPTHSSLWLSEGLGRLVGTWRAGPL